MYLIHTFYKLPPSKHLWPDLSGLGALINKMLRSKPKSIGFDPEKDLEPSIRVFKIDTELLPEYEKLFIEDTGFNWLDMFPAKVVLTT